MREFIFLSDCFHNAYVKFIVRNYNLSLQMRVSNTFFVLTGRCNFLCCAYGGPLLSRFIYEVFCSSMRNKTQSMNGALNATRSSLI